MQQAGVTFYGFASNVPGKSLTFDQVAGIVVGYVGVIQK